MNRTVEMDSHSYPAGRFQKVWNSLDDETREQIRAKAKWEHMTLAAVMREWWPELFERLFG